MKTSSSILILKLCLYHRTFENGIKKLKFEQIYYLRENENEQCLVIYPVYRYLQRVCVINDSFLL